MARYKVTKEQLERVVESFVMESTKSKKVVKENDDMDEAFGDAFRSYDTIFFRDNKDMLDSAKNAQGEEKESIFNQLMGLANKFIKEKGIEAGSAQSLKNELRRRVYGGEFKGKQS
jgi:hypothetical protein